MMQARLLFLLNKDLQSYTLWGVEMKRTLGEYQSYPDTFSWFVIWEEQEGGWISLQGS